MALPRLYQLFSILHPVEIRQVGRMVRSPFFTYRKDVERMFRYLSERRSGGRSLPDKTLLFQHTLPEEAYDDQRLRGIMSELTKLIMTCLIWEKQQKDTLQQQLALAAFFRERNLSDFFRRTLRRARQLLEQEPHRNPDHYQNVLDLQVEELRFRSQSRRTGELNLQEISDTLDTLYLAQKLRHACTQLSHQAVFDTRYDYGLLPHLITAVETEGHLDTPAVAVYYYCYRFLTEAYHLEYFQQFKHQLFTHGNLFPEEELRDLYLLAINFCIRQLNEGSLPFTREGWELYQEALKKGVLLENGRMSTFTFDNIVGFGIKMTYYREVESFIATYRDKLETAHREGTVHFNQARLEYARRRYGEALHLLRTTDFKDLVKQLIAKTLLLKIYYETGEYDLLEAHLDSFRAYIRRRELSEYHRHNFSNIIHLTRRLLNHNPFDKTERRKLRREIEQVEILTEREWLLRQLD